MLRISLSSGQAPPDIFGPGWLKPEPAQCWAVGPESWLFLPVTAINQACRLAIRVRPHLDPGRLKRQRLVVEVNRHRVAEVAVTEPQVVCALIPPACLAGRPSLALRLLHPDNAVPSQSGEWCNHGRQRLAIAYQDIVIEPLDEAQTELAARIGAGLLGANVSAPATPALELDVVDLIGAFESAGNDCEFGQVQRALGLERPSLIRFAGIDLFDMMLALRERFAHIAADGSLEMFSYPNEPSHDFMGRENRYNMVYHTGILPGTIDPETLCGREAVRLRRLAEKYLEDIASDEKIFVFKSRMKPAPVLVAGLVAAFRALGPATLMWVRQAGTDLAPGTARWLIPGLIVAYVDRLNEPPVHTPSTLSWLAACRDAYGLWRERAK